MFERAHALTNAEVSAILQKIVAAKKQDDPGYQPNPLLAKTQEYVDCFSNNKSEALNQQVRTCAPVCMRSGLLHVYRGPVACYSIAVLRLPHSGCAAGMALHLPV